jgi:hypothetical protein
LRISTATAATLAVLAVMTFLAFLLRLWWAQYSPAAPEPPRFDDSLFYFNMAQNIAEGRGYVHPASGLATAQWPPGYPAFLAALFTFTGPSVTAAEMANAALGALTVAMTALLAWLLVRERAAAIAAGFIVAVMPSLVMFGGVVWSESLFTALLAAGLALTVVAPRARGSRRWLAVAALSVVTAAAALTREAGLVLIPVAGIFWFAGAMSRRHALQMTGALTVTVALLILPWTIRNIDTLGAPVLISSSSAGNFWEGHHDEGVSNDLVLEYGPLNRPGGEADVNRAMWREGWRYVRAHPWEEVKAVLWKTRDLYRGDSAGVDVNDGYGYLPFTSGATRDRWLLLSDVVYYATLILAGVGIVLAGGRSPLFRLGAPVALLWTAGHVAFFVDPRFHIPLLPVFACAAGVGIARATAPLRLVNAVFAGERSGQWTRIALLLVAGAAAISGAGLLLARELRSSTTTEGEPFRAADGAPRVIYARQLCTLSNEDADAAFVAGADGGMSIVVGDRIWWLFGDTLFHAASGKQIEQNSIAWSTELRPDGCPRLNYHTRDGIAVPFLAKDGSLTVWPAGAWPVDDHTFDFYTSYIYGSGPYAYTIGEIGVARFDTDTMESTVLSRRLWDATSGFSSQVIGTQPVEVDEQGRLRVILQTNTGAKYLARVEPARMSEAPAYEFWDGDTWTGDEAAAVSLWDVEQPRTDIEKLAEFENGAWFAWNEALGQYVAVVNTTYAEVGARVADRLEGPWSEPMPWVDCLTLAQPRVPTCYSPIQHPQLAGDGGRTIVLTLTRMDEYQTVVLELTLGVAIHEYRQGDHVRYAAASPGEGWSDGGVAFYAADSPLPGFVAVYRWEKDGESAYGVSPPTDDWFRGEAAFYAPPTERIDGSLTSYLPVLFWRYESSSALASLESGLENVGYERGAVAFYAP